MTHTALTFPTVLTTVLASKGCEAAHRHINTPFDMTLNPAALTDLELLEELEDRMLLSSGGGESFLGYGQGVQFRSR